jgi:hypothetical protein
VWKTRKNNIIPHYFYGLEGTAMAVFQKMTPGSADQGVQKAV